MSHDLIAQYAQTILRACTMFQSEVILRVLDDNGWTILEARDRLLLVFREDSREHTQTMTVVHKESNEVLGEGTFQLDLSKEKITWKTSMTLRSVPT